MSNRVHLHCDGVIGLGGPSPAPCGRQLAANSRYTNATELREVARQQHGWKTGRQRINAPWRRPRRHWQTGDRLPDDEGVRTWTEPVDLCREHAGQMKQLTREKTLPLHDITPEATKES